MSLQKPLKSSFYILQFLVFTAFLLSGCSEKPKRSDYVARVNNSYLTDEEVKLLNDSTFLSPSAKTEFYQNWVKTELLYQAAVKKGVLDDKKFQILLERSKKELAASFFLNKLSEEHSVSITDDEIKKYYNKNPLLFKTRDRAFTYDRAVMSSEQSAANFRQYAVTSGWNVAERVFKKDSASIDIRSNIFRLEHQIESGFLYRLLHLMMEDDISLVFNTAPGRYEVIRLRKSFQEGEILPYEIAREQAEIRLREEKRKEYLEDYLKELYSGNTIEIRN